MNIINANGANLNSEMMRIALVDGVVKVVMHPERVFNCECGNGRFKVKLFPDKGMKLLPIEQSILWNKDVISFLDSEGNVLSEIVNLA